MKHPRPRAFTLVELLVTIGIIAVLISILVPVVAKVRQHAQTANTANQLQRLGMSITQYYNDFNAYPGVVPNASFPNGAAGSVFGGDANFQKMTQAEDLAVCLLGGYVLRNASNPTAGLNYSKDDLGKGTISFNPRQVGSIRKSYAGLNAAEISPVQDKPLSTSGAEFNYVTDSWLPEYLDLYSDPRPLIYMRANRGGKPGQIVSQAYDDKYTYNFGVAKAYLKNADPWFSKNGTEADVIEYFATDTTKRVAKYADSYILISAGPDRQFGTTDDIRYGGGGGQ